MKGVLVTAAATLLLVTPATAQLKPCDELKSEKSPSAVSRSWRGTSLRR